eukprot:1867443-Alexandrium_andersonii.AAC.1
MHAAGAAESVNAASKVGVRVKMRRHRAEEVPNPASHAQFGRVLHVTDKPVKLAVTLGRPLGDFGCEETNSVEEVESRNAGHP